MLLKKYVYILYILAVPVHFVDRKKCDLLYDSNYGQFVVLDVKIFKTKKINDLSLTLILILFLTQ